MVYSGLESGLRDLYLKLKQIFEGTSEHIGEIAIATRDVANEEPAIRPLTTTEKTLVLYTNMISHLASPILDSEALSHIVKR